MQVAAAGPCLTAAVAPLVVESWAEFLHRTGTERTEFTIERKGADSTEDWRNRTDYDIEDGGCRWGLGVEKRSGERGVGWSSRSSWLSRRFGFGGTLCVVLRRLGLVEGSEGILSSCKHSVELFSRSDAYLIVGFCRACSCRWYEGFLGVHSALVPPLEIGVTHSIRI